MVPGERSAGVLQSKIKYLRAEFFFSLFFLRGGSRDERCKPISQGPGPHQNTFLSWKANLGWQREVNNVVLLPSHFFLRSQAI